MKHGILTTYRIGCRCTPCKEVAGTYQKRLRYDHQKGAHRLVPTTPVREHWTWLREQGMTWADIAAAMGYTATPTVHRIMRRDQMRRSTFNRALAIQPKNSLGNGYLDATATRRRLQALCAIGYTQAYLAQRLGVASTTVSDIVRCKYPRVLGYVASGTAALYTELEATPGPSDHARTVAKRNGWAPPAAWDRIEDPKAKPIGVRA